MTDMDKMKILQINKFYHPVTGGVERVVQQVVEGLSQRMDMTVLVCQKKGKRTAEKIKGAVIHRASSWGVVFSMPISLDFFRQFLKLKKEKDIIHIHMPFPLADVAMALFGFKGKVVLWWHSDVIRQKKLMLFYKPFLLKLLKRADLITVATEGHITGSDYLPMYREKCAVIPYGVNNKILQASDRYVPKESESNVPVRFLFVGRLAYYKGVDVLINAFAKVARAELVIVGDGPLDAQLKERAGMLIVNNRIRFVNNVSDDVLPHYFSGCDVFILPSVAKSEAFGLVQIEAMVFGKPVINTQLPGGVPYVSVDGLTGFTVPPADVNALAKAMQKLADDETLRKKFGEAAYKRAREEFSADVMIRKLHDEYEKLMTGK